MNPIDWPIYLPKKAFPPYSFVGGHWPHPSKDRGGHSYGVKEGDIAPLSSDSWWVNSTYLFAIDLFNHGYYWEAHEQWEQLWIKAGRQGQDGQMLKGLIKLSAAAIKIRQHRRKGVTIHSQRALDIWQSFLDANCGVYWCGLKLERLIALSQSLKVLDDSSFDPTLPVERVYPIPLVLHFPYGSKPQTTSQQSIL